MTHTDKQRLRFKINKSIVQNDYGVGMEYEQLCDQLAIDFLTQYYDIEIENQVRVMHAIIGDNFFWSWWKNVWRRYEEEALAVLGWYRQHKDKPELRAIYIEAQKQILEDNAVDVNFYEHYIRKTKLTTLL